MKHLAAATLALLLGLSPTPASDTSRTEPPVSFVHTNAANHTEAAHSELIGWAMVRFDAAGLDLPALEIQFHTNSEGCRGNRGMYNSGLRRVDMCVKQPLVLLHELGHAWADRNLDADRRAAYVAAQGLESWNDAETAWAQRGFEHAADSIAWALLEEPIRMLTPDGPIAQRAEVYQMLTGFEVPRMTTGITETLIDFEPEVIPYPEDI